MKGQWLKHTKHQQIQIPSYATNITVHFVFCPKLYISVGVIWSAMITEGN